MEIMPYMVFKHNARTQGKEFVNDAYLITSIGVQGMYCVTVHNDGDAVLNTIIGHEDLMKNFVLAAETEYALRLMGAFQSDSEDQIMPILMEQLGYTNAKENMTDLLNLGEINDDVLWYAIAQWSNRLFFTLQED